jgi:flagellar hook-associated protein 2
MAATSSDAGIVPTVTGAAVASSFTVNVTHLARAQKTRSDAQSSATAALGQAGDLSIKVGSGAALNVSVLPTDSLADIATKISQSGARVSASVINAGGSYRLSIQGLDTGAANSISFAETSGLALGLSTPANTYETAQDAQLTIDGLAVTRPTNSVADVIPGVTLALTKTTTSPATVRVAGDTTSLKTKINALVSAYNDIVNTGHNVSGYGTTKAQNPVLAADRGIRRSLDTISSLISGIVPGSSGTHRSLASVGLTLSRDGVLSFDGAKLDAALEKDPDAVRRLFVTDTALGATGVMKTLGTAIDNLITGDSGAVKNRIDGLAAQSKRLVDSRSKKEESLKQYEQQLRRQFSNLDIAMSRYQSMASALTGLGSGSSE